MTLIDELLAEQGRLQTPVARFAAAPEGVATNWSDLIPLSAPRPGEQYAFEVSLDACTGCKACVAACHALNGLDEHETWRDIGALVSPDPAAPFSQTITTACHHCEDPACLHGCPVLAYEKDPVTGIVRHLDDQCIGCNYCVLKCPYDVPKYNPARGIVRKCDMCHGRLAHGEAPACVQACPTHAIRIVTITTTLGATVAPAFLPAAPDPDYTRPTTRYVSKRPLRADLTAPHLARMPEPAHWPLVLLLTFLPLAVGCLVAAGATGSRAVGARHFLVAAAWAAGAFGLVSSFFHLGKPLRAWRIFLGVRRSWLSREALALGLWFSLVTMAAIGGTAVAAAALVGAAISGVGALGCSVMVYVDTRREFWRLGQTAPRFLGSALIFGLAGGWASLGPSGPWGLALALVVGAKLVFEARSLQLHPRAGNLAAAALTAQLFAGPLRPVWRLRVGAALAGGVLAPALFSFGLIPAFGVWLGLVAVFLGELAERYLFFRAVIAPRMPGVVAT